MRLLASVAGKKGRKEGRKQGKKAGRKERRKDGFCGFCIFWLLQLLVSAGFGVHGFGLLWLLASVAVAIRFGLLASVMLTQPSSSPQYQTNLKPEFHMSITLIQTFPSRNLPLLIKPSCTRKITHIYIYIYVL